MTAELSYHLRVPGVAQPPGEEQGLGGVEANVAGSGGGEVRVAALQQALGGLERALRLREDVVEGLRTGGHPVTLETMAPSLRALIRYGSEGAR